MSHLPSSNTVSADVYATTVAADDDDGNGDAVGFESTTMLSDPISSATAMRGSEAYGGGRAKGTVSSASPYALYEPLHAQQQQGVLSAAPPLGNVGLGSGNYHNTSAVLSTIGDTAVGVLGSSASTSILPPPFPPPIPQQQQQSTACAYVEEGLDVPLHAPRLHVPTDLPLEQTTLIDLLATMVVQGGPTTEEEIVKREMARRNPAFAFLSEKFNHPCLLYYRWRLYSLLQQDTLLSWRTTPFQIESARRAYVFVPPPPLHAGPECLMYLHQPELCKSAEVPRSGSGVKRARENGDAAQSGDDGDEEIITCKARHHRHRHHRRHRQQSATAPGEPQDEEKGGVMKADTDGSRGAAAEPESAKPQKREGRKTSNSPDRDNGSDSSTSSSSSSSSSSNGESNHEASDRKPSPSAETNERKDDGADHGMDEVKKAPAEELSAAPTDETAQRAAASSEADPPVPLPPPSAQWISRQCIQNKHIFTVLQPHLRDAWVRLLNPRFICEVSACASLEDLCEAWLSRREVAVRMAFAVEHADGIHHLFSLLLDAVVKTAYVATARSRAPLPATAAASLETNSSVFCVEALWYMFVLHDILMNASNMPAGPTTAATACCVNKNVRPTAAASSSAQPCAGADDEEPQRTADNSPAALEALYAVYAQQQLESLSPLSSASRNSHVHFVSGGSSGTGFNPPPPPSTAHVTPSSSLSPSAAAAAAAAAAVAAAQNNNNNNSAATATRHRRRQRTTRRRSPYERCGDALELILPTLLEAVTAIALAVSLDKERQPPPQPPSSPAARVHHFKVVSPFHSKKKGGADRAGEAAAAAPLNGGPCLSLRLDAGCSPVAPTPVASATATTTTTTTTPEAAPATVSSAPAVLLLEWLKALVLVWMNVEQPLLLPLPSSPPPPAKPKLEGGGAGTSIAEVVVAAPPPPGLLWPHTTAGAPDSPDVQLAYHVDAQYARVLGLEAAPTHGTGPQLSREERREPPLLSARACAIIKDRYSFLF